MNPDSLTLTDLLYGMDVPESRKQDWRWLSRNLAFKNSDHPDFNAAMREIRKNLQEQVANSPWTR